MIDKCTHCTILDVIVTSHLDTTESMLSLNNEQGPGMPGYLTVHDSLGQVTSLCMTPWPGCLASILKWTGSFISRLVRGGVGGGGVVKNMKSKQKYKKKQSHFYYKKRHAFIDFETKKFPLL